MTALNVSPLLHDTDPDSHADQHAYSHADRYVYAHAYPYPGVNRHPHLHPGPARLNANNASTDAYAG